MIFQALKWIGKAERWRERGGREREGRRALIHCDCLESHNVNCSTSRAQRGKGAKVNAPFCFLCFTEGETPNFKTRDFIINRGELEQSLYKAVRERLGGVCCASDCSEYEYGCPPGCKNATLCDTKNDKGLWAYVKYFQLGSVDIPTSSAERLLKALILKEDADREKLLQEAQVVRKGTEAEVREIQNQAKEISQRAEADSKLIASVAAANQTALLEKARSGGLKQLYSRLGLNTQELKNSFDYLRTLRTLNNLYFSIDFQQRIAGSVS